MLWTVAVVLIVLWALGLIGHVGGSLIHLLLVIAIIAVLLRVIQGRGVRAWSARTLGSNGELKYVNVRRLLIFLEHSIDRGTQWAVFEPNAERLWNDVRTLIENFLTVQWHAGALLGTTPREAFFVKCDRTTMTQNDIDNGRMICLVGVAVVRPAEFVIFRIGQWTGDRKE